MKNSCLTPKAISEILTNEGVRPTMQRVTICQYVLCNADHPTADEVRKVVNKKYQKISLATIYNTLNTLVGVGLLKELRLPNKDKVVYDANIKPHFHFIDSESGAIIELTNKDVSIEFKDGLEIDVDSFDLIIKGKKCS